VTSVAGAHFSLYTKRRFILSIEQVREFNTTFGVHMSATPTTRVPAAGLRYELLREEIEEYVTAKAALNIVEIADALGDIQYVSDGAALVFGISDQITRTEDTEGRYPDFPNLLEEVRLAILYNDIEELAGFLSEITSATYTLATWYGIDLDAIVDAIHKSNMSKLGEDGKPIYREGDGKVLKGPNYKTPTDDIRKLVFGDNYAPASE
jgi:predicted HAD superfamily Cof-like phosphohydrolase